MRDDIDFELAFISDLKAAVADALGRRSLLDFADPSAGAHTGFLSAWVAAVAADATAALRPKYGRLYGYEAATPANAEMVAFDLFEHR